MARLNSYAEGPHICLDLAEIDIVLDALDTQENRWDFTRPHEGQTDPIDWEAFDRLKNQLKTFKHFTKAHS